MRRDARVTAVLHRQGPGGALRPYFVSPRFTAARRCYGTRPCFALWFSRAAGRGDRGDSIGSRPCGGGAARFFWGRLRASWDELAISALAADVRLMRRAGVEGLRMDFPWFVIEPARASFAGICSTRSSAGRPEGNRRAPGSQRDGAVGIGPTSVRLHSLGADRSVPVWQLSARVDRALRPGGRVSGPRTRGCQEQPIRHWQIYNEPSASYFWATPDYQSSYPALLRVAYQAVHEADPGAKVVIAGLASFQDPSRKEDHELGGLARLLSQRPEGQLRCARAASVLPYPRGRDRHHPAQ